MTELDRALIRRKVSRIVRNLEDLAQVEGLSLEEFRADRFRQKGTERLLQEVVEAAIDLNLHLLRVHGTATPPDAFSSFILLGEKRILPDDVVRPLAPSTGLRNRLVHEYDELDDEVVLAAVGEARRLYSTYARAVERLIEG